MMSAFHFGQSVDGGTRNDILADDAERGRRILRLGLFHETSDLLGAAQMFVRFDVHDSVLADEFPFHILEAQHGRLLLGSDLFDGTYELLQSIFWTIDEVITEEDREPVALHPISGLQNGMTVAFHLLLVRHVEPHVVVARELLEHVRLAALGELAFELRLSVEELGDGLFAAADDEADVVDADAHALVDEQRDDGLVADGQKFLGDDLRPGQESRAETGDGQDGLGELHGAQQCSTRRGCAGASA